MAEHVALRNTAILRADGPGTVGLAFKILDNFDIPLGVPAAPNEVPKDDMIGATQWTTAMDTRVLRYYQVVQRHRSFDPV